ncbi:NAD-P-binding protein [Trametes punicea]|nr:NAD-P-binding protein [Trametes punicea]
MGGLLSKKPTFDPSKDLADLTGKVVIVTGGNSGIGYATVQHLARRGAKVYIGARNEERAKAAIERLRAEGLQPGDGPLDWFHLDLSDPRKAKLSAEAFLAKEKRLDILVNNAGIMRVPYRINKQYGIQDNMLINHVSPFIFTRTLLPLLRRTAEEPGSDVRIVVLSSDMITYLKGQQIHFRDINDFNEKFGDNMSSDLRRYALSKLANILFVKQLQGKFDSDGAPITVLSVYPGTVYTEGVLKDPFARMPILGALFRFYVRHFFDSPSDGAYSTVFAAASPVVKAEREKYKGAFLGPRSQIVTPPLPQAESKDLAKELWETTEAILKTFDLDEASQTM